MAKNNEELTPNQKYKKYRRNGYILRASKWISILAPYITIGIVNFEEYFTETNGVKMSIGCVLAMMVAGVAIYNESKDTNKKVNNLVGWAVAFALVFLLQSILNDLVLIVGCGLIGQIIGAGFDIGAKNQLEKSKIYRDAIYKAEAYNGTPKVKKGKDVEVEIV